MALSSYPPQPKALPLAIFKSLFALVHRTSTFLTTLWHGQIFRLLRVKDFFEVYKLLEQNRSSCWSDCLHCTRPRGNFTFEPTYASSLGCLMFAILSRLALFCVASFHRTIFPYGHQFCTLGAGRLEFSKPEESANNIATNFCEVFSRFCTFHTQRNYNREVGQYFLKLCQPLWF